jgi:hypothetical protein
MAINIKITVFWGYCHVDNENGGSRLLQNTGNVTNLQSFTYWKTAIVRTIHPKKLFVIGQMAWFCGYSWLSQCNRKCVFDLVTVSKIQQDIAV